MDTWLVVLLVVIAVVVVLVVALAMSRRSKAGQLRKQEQAREHLQEAHVRGARADQEQALAEEQAARARRERAEVEERTALAEQEARERAAHAGEEQAAADELRVKAQKIAPDVTDERGPRDTDGLSGSDPGTRPYGGTDSPVQREGYPEQPEGGATRR